MVAGFAFGASKSYVSVGEIVLVFVGVVIRDANAWDHGVIVMDFIQIDPWNFWLWGSRLDTTPTGVPMTLVSVATGPGVNVGGDGGCVSKILF